MSSACHLQQRSDNRDLPPPPPPHIRACRVRADDAARPCKSQIAEASPCFPSMIIPARNKGPPARLFSRPRKKYLRRIMWMGLHTKHLPQLPRNIHHTDTATGTRDRYEKAASTLSGTAPLHRSHQEVPFRSTGHRNNDHYSAAVTN